MSEQPDKTKAGSHNPSDTISRNYGGSSARPHARGEGAAIMADPNVGDFIPDVLDENPDKKGVESSDEEVDFLTSKTDKTRSRDGMSQTSDQEDGEISDDRADERDPDPNTGAARSRNHQKPTETHKDRKQTPKVGTFIKTDTNLSHVFNFVSKPVAAIRNLTKTLSPAPRSVRGEINVTYGSRHLAESEGNNHPHSPPKPQRAPRNAQRVGSPATSLTIEEKEGSLSHTKETTLSMVNMADDIKIDWGEEDPSSNGLSDKTDKREGAANFIASPLNPSQVTYKDSRDTFDTDTIIDKLISDLPNNPTLAGKISALLTNKGQSDSGQKQRSYSSVTKLGIQNTNTQLGDTGPRPNNMLKETHENKNNNNTANFVSFQDKSRKQDVPMPPAAESLWRLARSSKLLSTKGNERGNWISYLTNEKILTPWAKGEADLPLFVKATTPLMAKIAQVRQDAAFLIQEEVAKALYNKADSDEKDTTKMLKTLREMLEDREECSYDRAVEKMDSLVDKELNELIDQLNKRTDFLENNQTPLQSFATSHTVFKGNNNEPHGQSGTPGPSSNNGTNPRGTSGKVPDKGKNEGSQGDKGDPPKKEGGQSADNTQGPNGKKRKNKNKGNNNTKGFPNPQTHPNNNESEGEGSWQDVSYKRGPPQGEGYSQNKRPRGNVQRGSNNNRGWNRQGPNNQNWGGYRDNHENNFPQQQNSTRSWRGRGRGPRRGGPGPHSHQNRNRGDQNNQNKGWDAPQNQYQGPILSDRELELIREYRKPRYQ